VEGSSPRSGGERRDGPGELGQRLLGRGCAIGATAVDVHLLEQATQPAELADRGGVGARNDRPPENPPLYQLGDR
jgi:hypothetical protein